MTLEELMRMAKERGASDLILTAGNAPVLRVDKKLTFCKLPSLSPKEIDTLIEPVLDEDKKKGFKELLGLSFIHSLSGWGRFRITLFKQRGSTAVAIRRFPYELPSVEDLHLPTATLKHFCSLKDGLVIVSGPAGGGKSTTLSAMIRMISDNQSLHIITLEDPIECLFKHSKSVIEQRSIPYDSPSFSQALKEILRQSPDVVVVGEIRDAETLRQTLRIAESGILVLITFHTATASDTISRLTNFFPKEEEQIRFQLSLVLRGVFSQQLIPMHQKQGVLPAWEVLIMNERTIPLIRDGNIQQLDNAIETGSKFGMQSMDQTLMNLYKRKLISKETLTLRLNCKETDLIIEKDGEEFPSSRDDQGLSEGQDTYNPNF